MWSQTFRQSLLLLPYKFILDTFEDWTICMENIQRTFDKVYDYNMKDSDIEIEALQSYGGSTSLKSKIIYDETFRQSLLLLPYKFILDTFEDWTICMENIQRTFDKVYDYNMKDSDIEIEALQSYGGSTSLKSKIIYDENRILSFQFVLDVAIRLSRAISSTITEFSSSPFHRHAPPPSQFLVSEFTHKQTFRQSLLLLPYKFILDTFEDWTICMENIQRTFDKVYDYNMKDSDIEIEALQSYGGSTSLKSKIIYDEVNSTLIIITCKI
ncbi:hypothetical protein P8452_24251 [Trifolium repens]|nr:hypothetical protein P8452_24251 [Trifolium repens]